ncbi:hypothetical protein AACH10_13360 [Ideonella sp. DXS22W]|uniref:Hedgehog/Intein (Hint) domain-containing protein n=1 Tax=Pseudaquabacterium inlustre TaxID=2984192 RepID=A0ABU9CL02_9BURK
MDLLPYVHFGDTPFSTTEVQLIARRGTPRSRQLLPIGLLELDHGDVVHRFQTSTGRLEEITRPAPLLWLNGQMLLFPQLGAHVRAHDATAFERGGFLVSPRYGLAFVPGQPSWVTALAVHCIDTWRRMG